MFRSRLFMFVLAGLVVVILITLATSSVIDDLETPSSQPSPFGFGTDLGPTVAPNDPFSIALRGSSAEPKPAILTGLTLSEFNGLADPGIKETIANVMERTWENPDTVRILLAEEGTWPDSSLGCPIPDTAYTPSTTSGVRMVISHQGQEYDYRIFGDRPRLCTEAEPLEPTSPISIEGLWSRRSEAPTARSEVAAAVANGRVYVFGGFGGGSTANEEYDPATDTWTPRAVIPEGVDHAAAAMVDGVIYLIGGFRGDFRAVDTVWAYDALNDTWSEKANLPTPRGALGAVTVGGKIFAIGGTGLHGDVGTVEAYDPAADTWSARSAMPQPRDHIAVSAIGGKIYVIGGRLGTYANNLDANFEYDPEADTWEAKASMPTARSGIAAASHGGKIYVFGGESTEGTFDSVEAYDPQSDEWSVMPPLPTARHGLAAVAVGNRIYVLSGGPTPGGSHSAANEAFIVFDDLDAG